MPVSPAARARHYRRRLRAGVRLVDVAVDAAAVSALERAGLLAAAPDGHEIEQVAQAIARLLERLAQRAPITVRPQATAPPAPAVLVPAPPPARFASVVVPGGGGQDRRR